MLRYSISSLGFISVSLKTAVISMELQQGEEFGTGSHLELQILLAA